MYQLSRWTRRSSWQLGSDVSAVLIGPFGVALVTGGLRVEEEGWVGVSLRLVSKGDNKGTCIGTCSTSSPLSVTLLTFPRMLTFLSMKRAGISDGELNLVIWGAEREKITCTYDHYYSIHFSHHTLWVIETLIFNYIMTITYIPTCLNGLEVHHLCKQSWWRTFVSFYHSYKCTKSQNQREYVEQSSQKHDRAAQKMCQAYVEDNK